jgi:hypothetical protein
MAEHLRFPDFGGRKVDQAHNAFSGKDEAPPAVLDPGDEAFLIVRVTASGVSHKEDRFGRLTRVQSLTVTHSLKADAASIEKVKEEIKRQQDEEAGQLVLEDDPELNGELDDDDA